MSNENSKHTYDDIIDLPHHISATRPQMSISNRAAQFSAFAALSGFDAAIVETARITDKRIDLDEESRKVLDAKLQIISSNIPKLPFITITYFLPDDKKDGGAYITVSESIKKIDEYEKVVVTTTGSVIQIDDIYSLEGDIFRSFEGVDD